MALSSIVECFLQQRPELNEDPEPFSMMVLTDERWLKSGLMNMLEVCCRAAFGP
jgi:hypothetical protein